MSSNDFIAISKKDFKVFHGDADCGFSEADLIGQGKNLEEAIEIAEKFNEEGIGVEYGIQFFT